MFKRPAIEDLPELFRRRRAAQVQKRADNTATSTEHLLRENIPFVSKHDGRHLIVAGAWDFIPSTGKYTERTGQPGKKKRTGRGVFNLIAIIQKEPA